MRILVSILLLAVLTLVGTVSSSSKASASPPPADYYEGFLDYAGKSGIFGWDANLTNMSESVEVKIFIDDKEVATVTANLYRHDLESTMSSGRHAFFYQIPAWYFDGMEHTVKVMHEAGGTQMRSELYSSPRTFTCSLE